jgi:uncharacterized protein (TIGR00645 family)
MSDLNKTCVVENHNRFKKIVEGVLFGSRWLLVLFYIGLIVALVAYAYTYTAQIIHLVSSIGSINSDATMMIILELIDMVMIASLVKMMITGSYHAFIDKHHHYPDEKASSGFLKLKLATSLIGVSAIHLLQSFMSVEASSWDKLNKQLIIHGAFLVGALVLAVIEFLHDKVIQPNVE